ncbi:MAG: phosphate signaling complex protein PhoU [Acidobacteriota bacterium]|nr:phosphate signaling complex protein PhoU [Acidobacteriota bacterium]
MRHFEEELDDLRKRLLEMSGLVESAIYRSVHSLVERDESLAQLVFKTEARINQMEIEIDEMAVRLLALEQPVATDLRLITSAIKINNDLERMGDLAYNVAERAVCLMKEPPVNALIDIPYMASLVESMVRKCLDAFVKKDSELARSVLVSDDAVDDLRTGIYKELIRYMEEHPDRIHQGLDLIFVARNLERIGDHATNISEDVLFLIDGVDVRHHSEMHT